MGTVISFFDDEMKADKAVSAMTQSKFSEYEWRVLTGTSSDDTQSANVAPIAPGVNSGVGYPHAHGAPAALALLDGFGLSFNKQETDYFSRLMDQGGTLLVVKDVDEDEEQQLVGFLNELGGKSTDDQ